MGMPDEADRGFVKLEVSLGVFGSESMVKFSRFIERGVLLCMSERIETT